MELNTSAQELELAIEEYKRVVAEIKMHQTLLRAALSTLQESKDAMAQLAIRLTAAQEKIKDLNGGKDVFNDRPKEESE